MMVIFGGKNLARARVRGNILNPSSTRIRLEIYKDLAS